MKPRKLTEILTAQEVSEGAGVRVKRSLGQRRGLHLDPFLMLDAFGSDRPRDYQAGFPSHPHRGFETVTYMLHGHLRHEDHLGNRGELRDGGVQWMTAGRGIVHSEMPQQTQGLMQGFQLWLNLPAAEKMKPASYRDIQPEDIPRGPLAGGGEARLIAGRLVLNEQALQGPVNTASAPLSTDPLIAELRLTPDELFEQALPSTHNVLLYVFSGRLFVGGGIFAENVAEAGVVEEKVAEVADQSLGAQQAGILSGGETLQVRAGDKGARLLLLAGRPIGEPVVQYGPFVMNTAEEIEQALSDYRDGVLTRS